MIGFELMLEGIPTQFHSDTHDGQIQLELERITGTNTVQTLPPGQWHSIPNGGPPRALLLKASNEVSDTEANLNALSQRHPGIPIILLLDVPLIQDLTATLNLKVSDFHDLSCDSTMLKARVRKWSDSYIATPLDIAIAKQEREIWRTLFQYAGAGMLTGKSHRFEKQKRDLLHERSDAPQQNIHSRIRSALRLVQWELNNEKATDMLALADPIAISSAFLDDLEFLNPEDFAADLAMLGNGKSMVQGQCQCTIGKAQGKTFSIEISLPQGLQNSILVTLLDISRSMALEEELRDHVNLLESRVEDRTKAMRLANSQLVEESRQRKRLAEQVRENLVNITQGVISAKNILGVALPGKEEMRAIFPQSILLERPRDIMGGDFLFTSSKNSKKFLALIDSTGHGIPGAMVSLMGSTLINKAFAELAAPKPSEILNHFRKNFQERMQVHNASANMYGFDAGVLMLDESKGLLEFAGARGDLYLVRDGETVVYRGTRSSIELNKYNRDHSQSYDKHVIQVKTGDQFYMVTDGIRDQFGGEFNRKLGRKRLADILAKHSELELGSREKALQQAFLIWKGANTKVDDATLIGLDI